VLVREGVAEGQRNDSIARLTGYLLSRRVDAVVVFELLTAWNEARCRPPLTESEIATIVDSIARCELKRRGIRVPVE
jgi:Primase C terminal 1 (PriCT-1)